MSKFTVFPYPTHKGCKNFDIDCSDTNSILIHAILSLASINHITGFNSTEILQQVSILCTHINWTDQDLQTYLLQGLQQGILTFAPGSNINNDLLYAVNAGMLRVNPANKKYFCIQQLYTS